MSFLPPWATIVLKGPSSNIGSMQIWKQKLHYAGLRFVSLQEHLFPHCLGTFSISSFPLHFLLSENNLKIISTWLPEKWQMLVFCSTNTNLALNCRRIQCWDYTKLNTETNTTTVRGHKPYTCDTENAELGIFRTGKQTNRKICPQIFMTIFFSLFLLYFCKLKI